MSAIAGLVKSSIQSDISGTDSKSRYDLCRDSINGVSALSILGVLNLKIYRTIISLFALGALLALQGCQSSATTQDDVNKATEELKKSQQAGVPDASPGADMKSLNK